MATIQLDARAPTASAGGARRRRSRLDRTLDEGRSTSSPGRRRCRSCSSLVLAGPFLLVALAAWLLAALGRRSRDRLRA